MSKEAAKIVGVESGNATEQAARQPLTQRQDAVSTSRKHLRKTATGWLIQAPAKLNLHLEVTGRRSDGFHELQTLITPIALFDTLHLEPHTADNSIRLLVHRAGGPGCDGFADSQPIPTDGRNLVVKALRGLQSILGSSLGIKATLWKRIPSQAGLGGGSSDAAAALVAGQRVFGAVAPEEKLRALSEELGSDVPVMLGGTAAVCRGRGEIVEPAFVPKGLACVLVQPPVGLGAGQVFSELRGSDMGDDRADRLPRLLSALWRGGLSEAAQWMSNNLQQPASRLTNWVERLSEAFRQQQVPAHQMSGSGSVYFGLCDSWSAARAVAARLRARRIGWVGLAATC